MKNITLFNAMIKNYNEIAFTHNYIFGFEYKHTIYKSCQINDVLPYVCTLDKSSEEGGGMAIRFIPNVAQKLLLLTNAQPVCSDTYFNALCKEKYLNAKGDLVKYNRGEVFEKLITESFGQTWVKDKTPFSEAPDVVGDGVPYQVKFEKATFACEKSLKNLTLKWIQNHKKA
jgi:hypothetical protein